MQLKRDKQRDVIMHAPSKQCVLYGYPTKAIGEYNTYIAYKCPQYGLICTDRIPGDREIHDLYSDRYYENYYNGIGYEHAYNKYLKKGFQRKIKLIRRLFTDPHIHILEVGSGPGYFQRTLKDSGYMNITGYEISDEAIHKASEIGIHLEKKDIVSANDSVRKFDLVLSWATIEHTVNPMGFFSSLMQFVRPGGYLLIDTGIIDTFFDRIFKGLTPWFYPPEHLFVFTRTALLKLASGYADKKVMINAQFSMMQRIVRSLVLIKHFLTKRKKNMVQDVGLLMVKK
jgi:SAM-dependent methyltransferase